MTRRPCFGCGSAALGLYLYGPGVEAGFGRLRYLVYYLAFGMVAALCHLFMLKEYAVDIPLVGASGAIAGVMGAFFVIFPRAGVRHFVIFLPQIRFSLPAWVVLGEWFLSQIYSAMHEVGGGIAFFAHIGGFLGGFVVTTRLKYGGDFRRAFARTQANQTINDVLQLPEGITPRMGLDMLAKELERSPDNVNLRYWHAVMASRAQDTVTAARDADAVLPLIPVEQKTERLNGLLLRHAFAGPTPHADEAIELSGLLSGIGRYADAEGVLADHLAAHPETEVRKTAVLAYKRAELLANRLDRPEEAKPIFQEIARGNRHDALVQGAEYELKKIAVKAGE